MPIQEFQTQFSLGYNGTDYFSPEMDFAVEDADLAPYVALVNKLLDAMGLARYTVDDLRGEMNQLKALIDFCHIHGLAVILDVVYNHAGGTSATRASTSSTGSPPRRQSKFALFYGQGARRRSGVRLWKARGA